MLGHRLVERCASGRGCLNRQSAEPEALPVRALLGRGLCHARGLYAKLAAGPRQYFVASYQNSSNRTAVKRLTSPLPSGARRAAGARCSRWAVPGPGTPGRRRPGRRSTLGVAGHGRVGLVGSVLLVQRAHRDRARARCLHASGGSAQGRDLRRLVHQRCGQARTDGLSATEDCPRRRTHTAAAQWPPRG